MRRIPLLCFLAGVLLNSPLCAQFSGRWKITLNNGSRSTLLGELRLPGNDEGGGGALLLEDRDSVWMTLERRVSDNRKIEFTVGNGERLHFEGNLVNQEVEGTVSVHGVQRYRWRGVRLDAQTEYYAAVPRFRQRQLRIGSPGTHFVIPGRWLAAAAARGETPEGLSERYTELSLRVSLTPLPPDSVARFGVLRAMGLFRRSELVPVIISTLERIRSHLTTDSAIGRFDYLFRPGGRWQVDIHDVALARARRPFPTISWESARPALAAADLLEDSPVGPELIPLALYRLFTLVQNDSAEFRRREQLLRRGDAASAAAALSLVRAYEEAAEWYVAAMRFLLETPWVPLPADTVSPAELVRRKWSGEIPVPEIRARVYGFPEGAMRVGTDSGLARLIVVPENATAKDWLARHGTGGLMEALHRLTVPFDRRTRLSVSGQMFRLTSVQEFAAESFSGFLEPADLVLLDPSYQPLLALGTLIHEWQHILHERYRQQDRTRPSYSIKDEEIMLTQLNPFLAEGFAEWMTEELLAPAAADFPLVLFGEAEKRVSLPAGDPHPLGYVLVRALAATMGSGIAREILLARASDPALVMGDPRVRRAWAALRGADRLIPRRGEAALFPLAVFTVEDGQPDLVQSQIIAPYIPPP